MAYTKRAVAVTIVGLLTFSGHLAQSAEVPNSEAFQYTVTKDDFTGLTTHVFEIRSLTGRVVAWGGGYIANPDFEKQSGFSKFLAKLGYGEKIPEQLYVEPHYSYPELAITCSEKSAAVELRSPDQRAYSFSRLQYRLDGGDIVELHTFAMRLFEIQRIGLTAYNEKIAREGGVLYEETLGNKVVISPARVALLRFMPGKTVRIRLAPFTTVPNPGDPVDLSFDLEKVWARHSQAGNPCNAFIEAGK